MVNLMKKRFVGATLIDPSNQKTIHPSGILVENGRITAVAEGKELSAQIDAEIIDLGGKFVIPGLIDCHIHMDMSDITLLFFGNNEEFK